MTRMKVLSGLAVILLVGIGVAIAVALRHAIPTDQKSAADTVKWIITGLIVLFMIVATVLLAVWFVRVFTRTLPDRPGATEEELKPMVQFCYVFTVYCLLMSFAPAIIVVAPQAVYYHLLRGPIALVKGCVHTNADEKSWALACNEKDPYKLEWFLNIGGAARMRRDGAGVQERDFRPAVAGDSPGTAKNGSDIDYWIDRKLFAPATVHGGLAVPMYVITLALMGATVSLARKVPEYQRRAIDAEDKTMTGPRMREALEFEVLQVLSAPLIAITAYNVITPSNMGGSAALGFASGFASEPLLMAIRSLIDRITGRAAGLNGNGASTTTLTTSGNDPQSDQSTSDENLDGCDVAVTAPTADEDLPASTGGVAANA